MGCIKVNTQVLQETRIYGVGDLHSHHILCVLTLCGIVNDTDHACNAMFCSGNNTTKYLESKYNITNQGQRERLMICLKKHLSNHTEQYLENSVCEMGRNEKYILNGNSNTWYDTIRKGQQIFRVGQDGTLQCCNENSDWKQIMKMKIHTRYPSEVKDDHWFYKYSSEYSEVMNEVIHVKNSCNDNKRRIYGMKMIHNSTSQSKNFELTPTKWSPAHKKPTTHQHWLGKQG